MLQRNGTTFKEVDLAVEALNKLKKYYSQDILDGSSDWASANFTDGWDRKLLYNASFDACPMAIIVFPFDDKKTGQAHTNPYKDCLTDFGVKLIHDEFSKPANSFIASIDDPDLIRNIPDLCQAQIDILEARKKSKESATSQALFASEVSKEVVDTTLAKYIKLYELHSKSLREQINKLSHHEDLKSDKESKRSNVQLQLESLERDFQKNANVIFTLKRLKENQKITIEDHNNLPEKIKLHPDLKKKLDTLTKPGQGQSMHSPEFSEDIGGPQAWRGPGKKK